MMADGTRERLRRLLNGLGENQNMVIQFSDMEAEQASETDTAQMHIALQSLKPGNTLLVRFTHGSE